MRQHSRRVRVLVVPVLCFSVGLLRLHSWTAATFPKGWKWPMWPQIRQEYRSRVSYCIPILASASIAYDVSKRPTPEMVEQAQRYLVFLHLFQKGLLALRLGRFYRLL